MPTDENDLQKEYKSLLAAIDPLVYQLKNPKDATNCLLWLTKLEEASVDDRPLRNKMARKLLENVAKKRLEHPFTEDPFDGSLQGIFETNKPKANSQSIEPNPSVFDYSMDSGISKYRQRAKHHKNKISQYQGLIKTMLQTEPKTLVFDRPTHVPLLKLDEKSNCNCDEIGKPPEQSTSLLLRIKNLENKTQDLEIKCSNAESNFRSKKKNRSGSSKSEKIASKYREQLQQIVKEKDETIAKLKEELNRHMSSETISHFEEIYKEKFNELENKYRRIIQDMTEKHSKAREKDSKTIEALRKEIAEK